MTGNIILTDCRMCLNERMNERRNQCQRSSSREKKEKKEKKSLEVRMGEEEEEGKVVWSSSIEISFALLSLSWDVFCAGIHSRGYS